MTDLPEAMTPADCDLRGYDFMPLFGHNLFSSSLYTESTDAEFRAAMRLWWSAWNQVPAASLPASDQALATLADYGRDLKGWAKVKERALQGFVLCSDGRLYHRFLAPEAVDAYERRLKAMRKRDEDRKRLKEWRERRAKQDGNDSSNEHESATDTPSDTPSETPVKRVSKSVDRDRDSKKERTLTSFVTPAEPSSQAVAVVDPGISAIPSTGGSGSRPPIDARSALWSIGVASLQAMTGKPAKACKSLIGKWLRDLRDDCATLNLILLEACETRPIAPEDWISAAVIARSGGRESDRARRWNLDKIDLDAAAEADMRQMGMIP